MTVVGAMFLLHMRMDILEPDALMSVTTHGTVEINMILLLAAQDGLVMKKLENALWPTQEMALVASQHARTIANQYQDQIHIDATLNYMYVKLAKQVIQDVAQIEQLNAETAKIQTLQAQLNSVNVIRPILKPHNAKLALRVKRDVQQGQSLVRIAIQNKIFMNVTKKH